ncbi:MAG: hypothetical protein ACKO23_13755, partial [Gemmataceae bacterium]
YHRLVTVAWPVDSSLSGHSPLANSQRKVRGRTKAAFYSAQNQLVIISHAGHLPNSIIADHERLGIYSILRVFFPQREGESA